MNTDALGKTAFGGKAEAACNYARTGWRAGAVAAQKENWRRQSFAHSDRVGQCEWARERCAGRLRAKRTLRMRETRLRVSSSPEVYRFAILRPAMRRREGREGGSRMGLLWRRQGVNAAGGELICGGRCSSAPPRETNARTATSGRLSPGPPHCVTGRGGNGGAQRRVALNRISVGGSLHVSGQAAVASGGASFKGPVVAPRRCSAGPTDPLRPGELARNTFETLVCDSVEPGGFICMFVLEFVSTTLSCSYVDFDRLGMQVYTHYTAIVTKCAHTTFG